MKIKIIRSPSFCLYQGYEYLPPFSIANIYAFLKQKGFDIVQEDLELAPNHKRTFRELGKIRQSYARLFCDNDRLLRYLRGGNDRAFENIIDRYLRKGIFDGIDILLISVICSDFYSSIMGLLSARHFKSINPGKPVVIGGEWPQRAHIYENFQLYSDMGIIDYYIAGHGEEPLYKLLQKINGAQINLQDIPGLCFSDSGKICMPTRLSGQVLTMPNFDGLILENYRWSKYSFFRKLSQRTFPKTGVLMLPIRMVYGCANRCAFCTSCGYKELYYLKPQEAVRNLSMLAQRYDTPYFFFMDDEVNVSEKFIVDFCDEILRTGLKIYWTACTSIRQINNRDTVVKMRKAGACRLIFGLETASPRLISFIHKNIELEHVSRVLGWSHEAGIWTGLEIIAGLPSEADEDVQRTVDFICANKEHLDEVWLNRYYLCIGSDMFNFPNEYGITNIADYYQLPMILKSDMENYRYSFDEVDGLSWDKKQQQIDKSYSIIWSTLAGFGLNPNYTVRDEINVLFYLYTYLSDKKQIKAYFEKYRNPPRSKVITALSLLKRYGLRILRKIAGRKR